MTYGEVIFHRRNEEFERFFKEGEYQMLFKNVPPRMEKEDALTYYNDKLSRVWRKLFS